MRSLFSITAMSLVFTSVAGSTKAESQHAAGTVASAPAAVMAPPSFTNYQVPVGGGDLRGFLMPPVSPASLEAEERRLEIAEYRAAMLTQHRADVLRHYPDVGAVLGLTRATEDKLLDLLAEQDLFATTLRLNTSGRGPIVPKEYLDRHEAFEKRIEALVGSQSAAELRAYRSSMPSRDQVNLLRNALATGREPLQAPQAAALLDVMFTEQQRVDRETQQFVSEPAVNAQGPYRYRDAVDSVWKHRLKCMASAHDRIRASAAKVLSPAQAEVLDGQLRSELAARAAGDQIMRLRDPRFFANRAAGG